LKETRLRGIDEVNALLTVSRQEFQQIVDAYVVKEKRSYQQAHDDMVKELRSTYEKVRRAGTLLAELSAGTEL